MKFTVVGLFESAKKAEAVRRELTDDGLDSGNIDLSTNRIEGDNSDDRNYNYREKEDSSGGFWDWLFGDDDNEREKYNRVSSGSTVVSVYSETKHEAEQIAEKMDNLGAIDVDEHYQNAAKTSKADRHGTITGSRNHNTSHATQDLDENTTVPVVEEDVAIGKRVAEGGGVRLRSKVIEKPVNEQVRLRKERVYVNRNPVDREVDPAEAFDDKTVTMTERSEEAVVEKTARVVEEITIGKEVEDTTENISETVRKTEIDIDKNLGGSRQNSANTVGHGRRTETDGDVRFDEGRIDRAFDNVREANAYYDHLVENGYSTNDITVMLSEETKDRFYADNEHVSDTTDDALKGAGTGSAIGGTAGAIAGAVAAVSGAVLVPGLGLAIAGPLAATLAGAGIGGASGAVIGALTNAGLSDSAATEYKKALDNGEIIISVNPEDGDANLQNYSYGREMYNGRRTTV